MYNVHCTRRRTRRKIHRRIRTKNAQSSTDLTVYSICESRDFVVSLKCHSEVVRRTMDAIRIPTAHAHTCNIIRKKNIECSKMTRQTITATEKRKPQIKKRRENENGEEEKEEGKSF